MSQAPQNPAPDPGHPAPQRTTLKLTTVGSSTGVILPKAMLEHLRVQKGDLLHVTEVPDGFKITALDEEFARQMEVAEGVMRERRDVLRRLAE